MVSSLFLDRTNDGLTKLFRKTTHPDLSKSVLFGLHSLLDTIVKFHPVHLLSVGVTLLAVSRLLPLYHNITNG